MKITSLAIVSLAGGGLSRLEMEKHEGEKNHTSHLQQAYLEGLVLNEQCYGFGKKYQKLTELCSKRQNVNFTHSH